MTAAAYHPWQGEVLARLDFVDVRRRVAAGGPPTSTDGVFWQRSWAGPKANPAGWLCADTARGLHRWFSTAARRLFARWYPFRLALDTEAWMPDNVQPPPSTPSIALALLTSLRDKMWAVRVRADSVVCCSGRDRIRFSVGCSRSAAVPLNLLCRADHYRYPAIRARLGPFVFTVLRRRRVAGPTASTRACCRRTSR